MIVTLVGFKERSFTDKNDGRVVCYIEVSCLIPPDEHKDNMHFGSKVLQFNSTRLTVGELHVGEDYEVIMSDLRPTKDGGYTTKPISLRPLF